MIDLERRSWRRPEGFTPEQIVAKLRQIEGHLSRGRSIALTCRDAEILEQSYYRWRKAYGGVQLEQARRLKELERNNRRPRRPGRRYVL